MIAPPLTETSASSLAEHSSDPALLADLAASDPPAPVCELLASNPHTPPETLAALAAGGKRGVFSALATNLSAPDDVLATVAAAASPTVARTLLEREDLPEETLLALASPEKPSSTIVRAVHHQNATSKVLLTALGSSGLDGGWRVAAAVADSPQVSDEVVEVLATVADGDMLAPALCSSKVSDPVRARFASDSRPEVRAAVAASTRRVWSPELDSLVFDDSKEVRAELAANDYTPPRLLLQLLADRAHAVRGLAATTVRAAGAASPPRLALALQLAPTHIGDPAGLAAALDSILGPPLTSEQLHLPPRHSPRLPGTQT